MKHLPRSSSTVLIEDSTADPSRRFCMDNAKVAQVWVLTVTFLNFLCLSLTAVTIPWKVMAFPTELSRKSLSKWVKRTRWKNGPIAPENIFGFFIWGIFRCGNGLSCQTAEHPGHQGSKGSLRVESGHPLCNFDKFRLIVLIHFVLVHRGWVKHAFFWSSGWRHRLLFWATFNATVAFWWSHEVQVHLQRPLTSQFLGSYQEPEITLGQAFYTRWSSST